MLMLDATGAIISPPLARQMIANIATKFGDIENLDFWAEMHPSQAVEWENCGIVVQFLDRTKNPATAPHARSFMGFPLEINAHLSPTVILIRQNHDIVAEIGRLGLTKWDMEEVNA